MKETKIEVVDGKVSLQVTGSYTAEEITELLAAIGHARGQVAHDATDKPQEGTRVMFVVGPGYWTEYGPHTGGLSHIVFRHPAFGWLGFALPILEATRLAHYLTHHAVLAIGATTTAAEGLTAIPEKVEGGGRMH